MYLAVNDYRSSTDHGFSNTWRIYECSAETRARVLRSGLPVCDARHADGSPLLSRMGIRPATAQERQQYRRAIAQYGGGARNILEITWPYLEEPRPCAR